MQKIMNFQPLFYNTEHTMGSAENRLWASVVLLLVDDAKNVKRAMLRYYTHLRELKHTPDFFTNVSAQEAFRSLEAWELDRQRVVNESNSSWFKEVCGFINFCERRLRNKVMEFACVEHKIIMEMDFWREPFNRAIQDREQREQIANNGRLKKKKKEHRPYLL